MLYGIIYPVILILAFISTGCPDIPFLIALKMVKLVNITILFQTVCSASLILSFYRCSFWHYYYYHSQSFQCLVASQSCSFFTSCSSLRCQEADSGICLPDHRFTGFIHITVGIQRGLSFQRERWKLGSGWWHVHCYCTGLYQTWFLISSLEIYHREDPDALYDVFFIFFFFLGS